MTQLSELNNYFACDMHCVYIATRKLASIITGIYSYPHEHHNPPLTAFP